MKNVGLDDFYEVRVMGLVSDIDRQSLIDLYEPLIGARALAVYLTLLEDPTKADHGLTSTHDKLLAKTLLSPGEFYKAVEALEATGLMKTYYKEGNGLHYFIYCLYSPKDPKEFFDDVLFVGTLKKYLGKEAVDALVQKYQTAKAVEGFEEVSQSFVTFFNPDFDDPIYQGKNLTYAASGHQSARVKTAFNYNDFLKALLGEQIAEKDLSKAEIIQAERLASLYSLDATTMGQIVSDHYVRSATFGKRCDFHAIEAACRDSLKFPYLHQSPTTLKSAVSSDTNLAKKIQMMDQMAPADWLAILQNGHKPASSDLKIIQSLSFDLGLPNPVINALVDFVLQKNDNVLSKAYIEKVGGALAREGVKTALDAMDYLKKINEKFSGKRGPKGNGGSSDITPEAPQVSPSESLAPSEVSDEDVEKALADLYNKK
jgi:replication initiation and membrane attachment protein